MKKQQTRKAPKKKGAPAPAAKHPQEPRAPAQLAEYHEQRERHVVTISELIRKAHTAAADYLHERGVTLKHLPVEGPELPVFNAMLLLHRAWFVIGDAISHHENEKVDAINQSNGRSPINPWSGTDYEIHLLKNHLQQMLTI